MDVGAWCFAGVVVTLENGQKHRFTYFPNALNFKGKVIGKKYLEFFCNSNV